MGEGRVVAKAINTAQKKQFTENLANNNPQDSTFGTLDERLLQQGNEILAKNNKPIFVGNDIVVPKIDMEHLRASRGIDSPEKAQQVADSLERAIHSSESIVDTSHFPHRISIRKEGEHLSDVAFLSASIRNQQPVLKTGHQVSNKRIESVVAPRGDALTPHRLPQEKNLDSTAAARISDFQGTTDNSSISKDMNGVKKNNSIDESKWLRTRFLTDDTEIYVREMEKVLGVDRKNSAYLAEQLSHGRIDSRTDEALQDLMKIEKKMQGFAQKNNISIEDLSIRLNMWSASQTPKAKEQGMIVPKFSEEEMQIMLDFGEYADESFHSSFLGKEFLQNFSNADC